MAQRNKTQKEKGDKNKMSEHPQNTPTTSKSKKQDKEVIAEEELEETDGPPPFVEDIMEAIKTCQSTLTMKIDHLETGMGLIRQDMSKIRARLTEVERRTSDTEDRVAEHQRSIPDMQKRIKTLEDRAEDSENRNRRNNLRLLGLPEGREGKDVPKFVETLLRQLLPDETFSPFFVVERAHRMPSKQGPPGAPARVLIFKVLNYKDRDAILMAARQAGELILENSRLMVFPDYTTATQKLRKTFIQAKAKLRERNIEYSMVFPAKLRVQYEEQIHFFEKPKDVFAWLDENPEVPK